MSMRVEQGCRALTEKEKQTLRLIVRGHDAKSTARSLGLSVHTINERLRDARRKLAVSSSRASNSVRRMTMPMCSTVSPISSPRSTRAPFIVTDGTLPPTSTPMPASTSSPS